MRSRLHVISRLATFALAVPTVAVSISARAAAINVTNDSTHRYGEVQIAVNPKNPLNIVYTDVEGGQTYACQQQKRTECEQVSAKLKAIHITMSQPRGFFSDPSNFSTLGVFTSFDGGKIWQRATIPLPAKDHPTLLGIGDPSVGVSPDGTFYISFDNMDWGNPDDTLPAGGIGVVKSTDGGKTWSHPVLAGTPMDGPKIAVDPNDGMIYANSSTVLGPLSTGNANAPRGDLSTRWIASSKDGIHWTKPQPAGGQAWVSAAHGIVAAAFKTTGQKGMFGDANNEICGSAPTPCVVFETSKDSGATWDRHFLPPEAAASSGDGPGGGPILAADPSRSGHFALALQMNNNKAFAVYETRDSGKTWNVPVTFADDPTKRHYHVAMNYSPNGILGLVWQTQQPTDTPPAANAEAGAGAAGGPPGSLPQPFNVWAIISLDGGKTFSAPLEVSGGTSPAPQGGPFGAGDDYACIALDRDTAFVGWADWRLGERQGFFNAIKLSEFKR
jgi:hypothetical protein